MHCKVTEGIPCDSYENEIQSMSCYAIMLRVCAIHKPIWFLCFNGQQINTLKDKLY
jgi:hypothetical protein